MDHGTYGLWPMGLSARWSMVHGLYDLYGLHMADGLWHRYFTDRTSLFRIIQPTTIAAATLIAAEIHQNGPVAVARRPYTVGPRRP